MELISKKEMEARTAAWKERYFARLLDLGLERDVAQECADGVEVDFGTEPEDAAADEMSYFAEG